MTSEERQEKFVKDLAKFIAYAMIDTDITPLEVIGAWERIKFRFLHKAEHSKTAGSDSGGDQRPFRKHPQFAADEKEKQDG